MHNIMSERKIITINFLPSVTKMMIICLIIYYRKINMSERFPISDIY